MIVLIGESASGKSSVARNLQTNYGYENIVSYTSRPKRDNEQGGVDYNFITPPQFRRLKAQGFFVETTCFNGWYYGTAKKDCVDDAVAVMNPFGFRQLKKHNDLHIVSFYIKVPRRDRLIKILERGDDIEEAYRRNLTDVGLFTGIETEVDYSIYNPNYKYSIDDISQRIIKYYRQ